jgi:hypothetical protein
MGLVPGSLGIAEVREDIRRTRDLTDRPFGLNLPLAFVKDLAIVDMIAVVGAAGWMSPSSAIGSPSGRRHRSS